MAARQSAHKPTASDLLPLNISFRSGENQQGGGNENNPPLVVPAHQPHNSKHLIFQQLLQNTEPASAGASSHQPTAVLAEVETGGQQQQTVGGQNTADVLSLVHNTDAKLLQQVFEEDNVAPDEWSKTWIQKRNDAAIHKAIAQYNPHRGNAPFQKGNVSQSIGSMSIKPGSPTNSPFSSFVSLPPP